MTRTEVANRARQAGAAVVPILVKSNRARLALERSRARSIASRGAGVCIPVHSIVPNRHRHDIGRALANVARRGELALVITRVRRIAASSTGVRSATRCIVPNRR